MAPGKKISFDQRRAEFRIGPGLQHESVVDHRILGRILHHGGDAQLIGVKIDGVIDHLAGFAHLHQAVDLVNHLV